MMLAPGPRWAPDATGALAAGAIVGILGGLIGLGGAEFRLPLLLAFGFAALPAVIVNKAVSLVVVAFALPLRSAAVAPADLWAQWPVMVNLLAGSLVGAWLAAGWATRLHAATLRRVIALLLLAMAAALLLGHAPQNGAGAIVEGPVLWVVGAAAGLAIGAVASLLGVAGGELLIPTLVLLFGLDIRLAGSVSLAVSLPTMLVGFARYSRDSSFTVLREHRSFVGWMAAGSLVGVVVGAASLRWLRADWIVPTLAGLLAVSALKAWHHGSGKP